MSTVARLYLLGPMRLLDGEGHDRTPKGEMLRALLATLALSRQGTRARVKLQDLLWGSRDQAQGSQSLRTAVSALRRALSAPPATLIEADHQVVRLDIARLWIDVWAYVEDPGQLVRDHPGELPELLEGLNIRAGRDDAFEDWLRDARSRWSERLERLRDQAAEPTRNGAGAMTSVAPNGATGLGPAGPQLGLLGAAPAFGVGLLPTIASASSPRAGFLGDAVLDFVATGLRDMAMAEIYDYRDGAARPEPPEGLGPKLLLRVKAFENGDRLTLTLLAYRTSQQVLLWSWPVEFPRADDIGIDSPAVASFVNLAIDRVCASQHGLLGEAPTAGTPYHALNAMFRLDAKSLHSVRSNLQRAYQDSGDPVHLSLLAYLNTFRVGEHWESFDSGVVEETRALVDGVLRANTFNSVALALTGHVCGYILHDYGMAADLLSLSTDINPHLAICWDHRALNHLYCGRNEEALREAELASTIGRFSPFRFTYDTTMCMAATLTGEYETAVRYGERALARRPDFGAPLRYTAVSLGHLGQADAAHRVVAHIRALAPDFSCDWVVSNRFAVVDETARNRLLVGLQKAGA